MTKNQLQFWAQKEQARSNLVREDETNRHNVATRDETYRHNREMEALGREQLYAQLQAQQEQKRANLAREAETYRSNLESERIRHDSNYISSGVLGESIQHNRAQESTNLLNASTNRLIASETARSNLENERIKKVQNTNQFLNLTNQASQISETKRHNVATETEAKRATNLSSITNLANTLIGAWGRIAAGKAANAVRRSLK